MSWKFGVVFSVRVLVTREEWEFAVSAETVKDIEDEYIEQLCKAASQTASARWKVHSTERASTSQGCRSTALVLIAGLVRFTWVAASY